MSEIKQIEIEVGNKNYYVNLSFDNSCNRKIEDLLLKIIKNDIQKFLKTKIIRDLENDNNQ